MEGSGTFPVHIANLDGKCVSTHFASTKYEQVKKALDIYETVKLAHSDERFGQMIAFQKKQYDDLVGSNSLQSIPGVVVVELIEDKN